MWMETKEVNGFYGGFNTPCTVFYHDGWYCVEGSSNVNHTNDYVDNGVDVELLSDNDIFTVSNGVHSLDELENYVVKL